MIIIIIIIIIIVIIIITIVILISSSSILIYHPHIICDQFKIGMIESDQLERSTWYIAWLSWNQLLVYHLHIPIIIASEV